ncbi:spore germination lipoprotein GerD [Paenibacillus sp.]|uniref:spore germination lipoprotein GerD n=1 Tax=Paenibacillus sp. TaxID=58172 RepID=UPI002D6B8307|nr:spore germination lipoprotein GerD [Paenibacillus sp.]HZG55574.1 spore germination lipoprotein GerD [Paenibacillus sp.]
MKRWVSGAAAVAAIALLTSCGQDQQQSAQVNYNEVKTMVVDILKTEDGQKAIKEASREVEASDFQQLQILSTGQGQALQTAVREVMSDPAYASALKEAMIDPMFAADFAKAIVAEDKKIHKALMMDPEYQQALIDVFKDPQFQALLLQTMKSAEYRQQIMTVMKEAIETPIFQQDILLLMERALEEQAKPKPDAEKGAKASQATSEEEKKKKEEEEKKKKEEEETL